MADVQFDLDPESKHKCQNCGRTISGDKLGPIRDFEQRVAPGEQCPSGECPYCECHAVCHPIPQRVRSRKYR